MSSAPLTAPSLSALHRLAETPLAVAMASILAFAALVAIAGCDAGPPAQARASAPAPANPLAGLAPVDQRLAGEVAEVLPADGYTYFRLRDGTWAVVMGPGPAVGQRIEARVFAHKTDFRSRRLDRTFAAVSFVSLSAGG